MTYFLYRKGVDTPELTDRQLHASELLIGGEALVFIREYDQKPDIYGKKLDANGQLTGSTRLAPVPPVDALTDRVAQLISALSAAPAVSAALPADLKAWATAKSGAVGPGTP
jgi:hypothetical protein